MMEPPPLSDLDLNAAFSAMGNDREIYIEVLSAYLESFPLLMDELAAALHSNDLPTIIRCAHTIKSSSRAIGGSRIGATAEALEHDAGLLSPYELSQRVAAIRIHADNLQKELRAAGLIGQTGSGASAPE